MYQDKEFVNFKLADLRYMMKMIHIVQDQQNKYILARIDIMAFAVHALESIEFVDTTSNAADLIVYE
jgi:hypothetical protein